MDFARKQMEKYGWKEGQGLGKTEAGITDALKPKLKNNNNGLGFDISEEFTNNWWEKLYKKASDNIAVTNTAGAVKLSQVGPDSIEISTSDYKHDKKGKKGVEQSFVKTSKIVQGSTIDFGVAVPEEKETKITVLSNDDLFKACGGRTAHKGARHGLNLSGKLARIEKQEKILLKQMRRISLNEETDNKVEKKCKKLEKLKVNDKLDKKDDEKMSKKKKKKKRKSVSFSNAIAEVIPEAEADSSFNSEDRLGYESSSAGEPSGPPSLPRTPSRSPSPYPFLNDSPPTYNNNNRQQPSTSSTLPDEGIEQDFPLDNAISTTKSAAGGNNNNGGRGNTFVSDETDGVVNDHKSFEERTTSTERVKADPLLSKAEKKLKMRKMRASQRFLEDIFPDKAAVDSTDEYGSDELERLQSNLKRKKEKLDDADDTESENKQESCKNCYKKSRKDRKQEKVVNRIAKGLEKVCKISEGGGEKKSKKL